MGKTKDWAMIAIEPKETETPTIRTLIEVEYDSPFGTQILPIGTIGFVMDKKAKSNNVVLFYPSNHSVVWNDDELSGNTVFISPREPEVPDWGERITSSLLKDVFYTSRIDQENKTILIKQKLMDQIVRNSAWLSAGVGIRKILFECGEALDEGLKISWEDANRLGEVIGIPEKFDAKHLEQEIYPKL